MWDEEDGFFYDVLHLPDGETMPMKVRSMVGLIPLFAVETLDPELIDSLPRLQAPHAVVHRESAGLQRSIWKRSHTTESVRRFLSLVNRDRLKSRAAVHAGRRGIPVALWHSRASRAITKTIPMSFSVDGHGLSRGL